MSRTAIEVKDLTVELDEQIILNNISFKISAGSIVHLLGGNGSGKSTLIRTILGLIPEKAGQIKIFNKPRTQAEVAKNIGYVPQYSQIDKEFPISVNEVINLECTNAGSCDIGVKEHLGAFYAQDLIERKISNLSGGEFQKVIIARALVTDPSVLILDEPTNNLDHETKAKLFEVIKRLADEHNKTILFVSHDHNIVKSTSDEVLFLDHGKLHSDSARHLLKGHHQF